MALDAATEVILRWKTGESATDSTWSSDSFEAFVAASNGNLDLAASEIWRAKAAQYAALVNISESGSSRSQGDLYKNAIAMSAEYAKTADGGGGEVILPQERAKSFQIER